MQSLKHIWLIAMKDTRRFTTDRMALLFSLLFPFVFVVMFHFMMQGIGGEDKRMVLNLATLEAEGGMSHQLIEAMVTEDESQLRPGEPEVVWLADYEAALRAVENKEMSGFLLFPADFTQGVMMGYGANIEVVARAEATDTRAALNGLAQAIASRVGSQRVATNAIVGLLVEQGLESGQMDEIGQMIPQIFSSQTGRPDEQSLIDYRVEKVGEVEPMAPGNFVIPGYLVMFVFFTAALSAEQIVRERQNRTLERMLASSVRRESILGGTYLGVAMRGLIQILLFWLIGILVFKIDLGFSPGAVVGLSLLMVVMSSAFAVMLATIARTERSAGAIAVLTSLVLAPLGGCWWPLFVTPKWMQLLAKVTPHGWATTGFNKLMVFGAEGSAVVPEMAVLAVFAVVFGIVAILRFRTSAV